MVMFPDDPNGAEKQRKVMEGANRFMDSLNKTKSNHKPTKQDQYSVEHIFTPISGSTSMRCTCGKAYATTDEQNQHIDWHLKTQALLQAERREAVEEFAKKLKNKVSTITYSIEDGANELIGRAVRISTIDQELSKLKGDK